MVYMRVTTTLAELNIVEMKYASFVAHQKRAPHLSQSDALINQYKYNIGSLIIIFRFLMR